MQAGLMSNLIDAKQIITEKSGHSIHLNEPEFIVKSVLELVDIYRKE